MAFSLLDGLRVLDMSQYAPGPYASLLLADLGADVVRVEPPGGEPMRRIGPADADGISAWYKVLNRSKRIVELDLKAEAGKAAFRALLEQSDALLESYRPGVLDRLGFSRENLEEINPRLVHCALSGWGQTGPYAMRGGHDLNYMALCGGLVTSGTADTPTISFPQVADYSSGVQAALSVVAALLGRERRGRDGKGVFIDTSIAESVLPWQAWTMTGMVRPGFGLPRGQTFLNGGVAYYNIYPTRDGRHVTIGAIEEKFWQAFCEAVDRPDWVARQHEEAPQAALMEEVADLFMSRDFDDWATLLADVDCCFEPVHDMAEVAAHPHIAARGMFRPSDGDDPFVEIAFPAWIDGAPMPPRTAPAPVSAADVLSGWAGDETP